jgi:hypothetical protein
MILSNGELSEYYVRFLLKQFKVMTTSVYVVFVNFNILFYNSYYSQYLLNHLHDRHSKLEILIY